MEGKIVCAVLNYTEYPGPRYQYQGNNSGEEFYYEIVKKGFAEAIESDKMLEIDLDGTAGYASSFIDESIGNLVFDFELDQINNRLSIVSTVEPDWKDIVFNDIIPEWKKKKDAGSPRKPLDLPGYEAQ